MDNTKPYLITLKKNSDKGGDLCYLDEEIPFAVKRLFWIYNVEKKAKRGLHAHENSEKCLVCIHGTIHIKLTNQEGQEYHFELNNPSQALYFPKRHWIELNFNEGAILVALASTKFVDDIFLTNKNKFSKKPS